jgi:hypothetical protein
MIGPFQITSSNGTASQTAEINRSDLLISTPQSSTELPSIAIGGLANAQALPTELPPSIHNSANEIGQIRSEYKNIEDKAQRLRDLDELRARLLIGKKSANVGDISSAAAIEAFKVADSILNIGHSNNLNNHPESNIVLKTNDPNIIQNNLQQKKDNSLAGIDEQQMVLLRIDEALNAINNIIEKIDIDQTSSKNKLFFLTGSVYNLNAARSTVDNTKLSLNVASNAVDIILRNIKTAVFAHGKVSNDMVRLVMS